MAGDAALGSLPSELVHLVHFVELNKSGWWDRAVDRVLVVSAWLSQPVRPEDLVDSLAGSLDHRVDRDRLIAALEAHVASGELVRLRDGTVKASTEVETALEQEQAAVAESIDRVKSRLARLAQAAGLEFDPAQLWDDFERHFMVPLVREAGARIYEVLAKTASLTDAVLTYGDIVRPMCESYGPSARDVLVQFIEPSDPDVRGYVLRHLNAQFAREAVGLDAEVLEVLEQARTKPERVRILVDTNFLFSFLGLHDNPSNGVAADLIRLVDDVRAHLKVEYFVLPITIEETRRVLRDVIFRLSGVAPSRSLAAGAHLLSSSGLTTRYLEAAAQYEGGVLTPDDFFGPYEGDLLSVLREKGVELLNENLDALRVDQAVIDDLHDQEAVQERHRKRGAKPYEANLHDMVLWHFVDRRRPREVGSPLELGQWVCTIDFGLIAFDRHKRKRSGRPPICLTPSLVTQLLQFWVPRSDDLDSALVGSLREPLLFLDFDRSTEAATLSILKTMSRFASVDDLSPSTVRNVLTNDALRAALDERELGTGEAPVDLVEAAIVSEAHRLELELERLHAEKAHSAAALENKVDEAAALKALLEERHQDVGALEGELTKVRADLDDERTSSTVKDEELGTLRGRVEKIEADRDRERAVLTFSAWCAVAFVVWAVAAAGGYVWVRQQFPADWLALLFIVSLGLLGWLLTSEQLIRRRSALAGSRVSSALAGGRRRLLALFGAVAVAALSTAIYDAYHEDQRSPAKPTTSTTARSRSTASTTGSTSSTIAKSPTTTSTSPPPQP
jgi:hypothetical protein